MTSIAAGPGRPREGPACGSIGLVFAKRALKTRLAVRLRNDEPHMDKDPETRDRPHELQELYSRRFDAVAAYRSAIWRVLVEDFFQSLVPRDARVLDIGCGYGEFINLIAAREKFGIDLNPSARKHLKPDVRFFEQDCSLPWPIPDRSLDVVFTSNFFEHLPSKDSLRDTMGQAHRCLSPGGIIIAMGPNIRYLSGAYWDFWDHSLCLSERSLAEGLSSIGYRIRQQIPRFLPYSMSDGLRYPPALVRLYLKVPLVWPMFGRQFLVIAEKR
jgi:SAM-dependent methyltransferase